MKRRFIILPVWKYSKIEQLLSDMESYGFRLDHISFRYFFVFRICDPKVVRYLLSCSFLKEYDNLEYEYLLRKHNNANMIPSYYSSFLRIYRITDLSGDLPDFELSRSRYLQKGIRNRITLTLLLLLLSFIGLFYKQSIVFLLLFAIFSLAVILNLYGLLYLKRKK